MTAYLSPFPADADPSEIAEALSRDGGVLIESLVNPDVMDAVYAEIQGKVSEEEQEGTGTLWPEGTKTVGGLAAVSPTFVEELLVHRHVLQCADRTRRPMNGQLIQDAESGFRRGDDLWRS